MCTDNDIEGIVKVLTLNKRYALGKIRFDSYYLEHWLPSLNEQLEKCILEDSQVVMNTEVVEITNVSSDCPMPCCAGFRQAKSSWEGDVISSSDIIENGGKCLATVTKFVNLLKQLSNNKCKFANGLCCIDCSEINIYDKNHFTADLNKISFCYYCECPMLPNFKCLSCITACNCTYIGEDNEGCNQFCCKDCKEAKQIDGNEWTAPGCVNADEDDAEDDD